MQWIINNKYVEFIWAQQDCRKVSKRKIPLKLMDGKVGFMSFMLYFSEVLVA